jgi:hypothetical protein
MMKDIAFGIGAVCIVLLSGCIFPADSSLVDIVSIAPDKTVYHSNEHMTLNVTLKASEEIKVAYVNVTGLENSLGETLLHKSRFIILHKGRNNVTFTYKMPVCSSCKKLEPGMYPLEVTVSYKGEILAEGTKEIELKQ